MTSCLDAGGMATEGETAGELSLGAASGRAGDAVPATLTNSGETCLTSGLKLQWEALQPDGSYAPATPPGPVTLEAYTIPQGETRNFLGTVWSNLSPGVYRAALLVSIGKGTAVLTSEPFRVVG